MATTMEEVRAVLDPEEPDYQKGVELGPDALPHLRVLINGEDPMLASKATYLAGLIKSDESADVVREAARSNVEAVRVAAAATARNLPSTKASEVLEELVADPDPGIRRVARESAPKRPSSRLAALLEETAPGAEGLSDQPGGASTFTPTSATMPGEVVSEAMPGGGTGLMPGEAEPGMPGDPGRHGAGGSDSMPS